jgi:hypothetical protein
MCGANICHVKGLLSEGHCCLTWTHASQPVNGPRQGMGATLLLKTQRVESRATHCSRWYSVQVPDTSACFEASICQPVLPFKSKQAAKKFLQASTRQPHMVFHIRPGLGDAANTSANAPKRPTHPFAVSGLRLNVTMTLLPLAVNSTCVRKHR